LTALMCYCGRFAIGMCFYCSKLVCEDHACTGSRLTCSDHNGIESERLNKFYEDAAKQFATLLHRRGISPPWVLEHSPNIDPLGNWTNGYEEMYVMGDGTIFYRNTEGEGRVDKVSPNNDTVIKLSLFLQKKGIPVPFSFYSSE
jgi:hypothetical protein